MTTELRGAIGSASVQQFYSKCHLIVWEGLAAKFVVGNRAQRCDCHKLARFWWVGEGVVLRADHVLWPILVKNDPVRNFERTPSHPALFRQCVQKVQLEALQFSIFIQNVIS